MYKGEREQEREKERVKKRRRKSREKLLFVFARASFSLPIGRFIMWQLNNMVPSAARSIRLLSAALVVGSGTFLDRH